METVEVEYRGKKLTVEGYYWKGQHGTYEDPPDPPSFDIHHVIMRFEENVIELTELLHDDYIRELEAAAIDKLEN